jgi:hypothetical protein
MLEITVDRMSVRLFRLMTVDVPTHKQHLLARSGVFALVK